MAYNTNKIVHILRLIFASCIFFMSYHASAQVLEWQLVNPLYSAADPDGAGPATGLVSFTLQVHTISGSVSNVSGISAGWSWQSAKAMLPAGPAPAPTCGTNSVAPAGNVVMSANFSSLGFTYNNVNQCSGAVNFSAGAQMFDRRSAGTIDGGLITLTTAWTDVLTVTLWTLDNTSPQGGYAVINSGSGSTLPDVFSTYAVADVNATEYAVNSLTFGSPLPLPSVTLPVLYTDFNAKCLADKSTALSWTTAQEKNTSYFELQKSTNSIDWLSIAKVNAAGNSSMPTNYQVIDPPGGVAFYRLKQTDKDGITIYSGQIKTSCDGKQIVSLYPVPATDKVTLVIAANRMLATNLQVYDSQGMLVISKAVSLSAGSNQITIGLRNLATGRYIIRSSNNALTIDRQFSVVR